MARDPYKYFRVEARELVDGLGRGALEVEKGNGGTEPIASMLRLAHTLKGASRVVRQGPIAELAHAVEDVLSPYREEGSGAVSKDAVASLLRLLDDISARVAVLEPAAESSRIGPVAPPESLRTVRVEIEEMDALLEGVSETSVRLAAIRRGLDDLSRARVLAAGLVDQMPESLRARSSAEELHALIARVERSLGAGLDHADREIDQVRDRAAELRLMPASAVFGVLERAARDAAQALDRSIDFEASGGERRLEANVLFALRDALLHVVRNAVAHGIEAEAERRRLGKPPAGRVTLEVQRRGNRIAFVCRDDGRGIDVDAVRRAAVARGVTTAAAAAALSPEQALRLVFESGVTTTDKVTEVSGRGVGLDVLRTTVAELKGEVTLQSDPGRGTTVDLCVPMSVASISALVLDVDGTAVSVPLDSVRRTLRLAPGDIARFADRDSVVVDGAAVAFLPLARALRGTLFRETGARSWCVVVLQAGSRIAALGADRLVGTTNIVLRPLPRGAGPAPIASGVSLDFEGNPQLVLDPGVLVAAAHAGRDAVQEAVPSAKERAPILIVDDSLTTRMLEQSILESAGYTVDLATSAEEALALARKTPHSLFLVDVEMPGMDGFEFVSRTRADSLLGGVPAILVSSRQAPEDRLRGEQAGARAYIVKGDFDQGYFLRTIRQLIG
jgi:two-component system chemotaxis sensor kinase CheA